jgi:predicted  nucleic acid-binding Zn-ribbon protein
MADKEAYVQKLHARIDEWNAEIDRLKAKAEQAEADARADYNKEVENLKTKRRDAEKKIDEVREAGEGAWEDLKAGTQSAMDAMEAALKSAKSRFK